MEGEPAAVRGAATPRRRTNTGAMKGPSESVEIDSGVVAGDIRD